MNFNRKVLKLKAKSNVRANYVSMVIVCLIIAILASGYSSSQISQDTKPDDFQVFSIPKVPSEFKTLAQNIKKASNVEQNEIDKIEEKYNLKNASEGVFATIFSNAGKSNSFTMGVLNTVNKFVFDGKILAGSVTAVYSLIMLFYSIFIGNIILVGEKRFFLESRNYTDTNLTKILFIYRVKRVLNVAKIMLLRTIFNILWIFTIVGGFVKYYSYMMIPYILAENPDISSKEVFKLSEKMMKGQKWQTFLLDISFFPWHILSMVSLGIASYFYVNPYLTATKTELYVELRKNIIVKKIEGYELFNDTSLIEPRMKTYTSKYPMEDFSLKEIRTKDVLKLDYDRKYSFNSIVIIFFIMCFVGWIWETGLHFFQFGVFVNRGSLKGPWLPIYGVGSVLFIVLLKPLVNKPGRLFLGAFVTGGVLEYTTSWLMEELFHQKWWDYKNMFLNINGRICLEGLLFFAAGAMLVVYFLAPMVDDIAKIIPSKAKAIVFTVISLIFISDIIYSSFFPNIGRGITTIIS